MSPAAYENTFGALLVGLLFASFLFGIVNIQVHHYFSTFPNDRTVFKLMVYINSFLKILMITPRHLLVVRFPSFGSLS